MPHTNQRRLQVLETRKFFILVFSLLKNANDGRPWLEMIFDQHVSHGRNDNTICTEKI